MTDNRTTELRGKLDERGVKWWPMRNNGYYEDRDTEFVVNGKKHTAHEWGDGLAVYNLTPEQAIAATLGSGTCCLYYGEDDDGYDGWYCDECGGWFQAVRRDGHLVEPKHCQECGKKVK